MVRCLIAGHEGDFVETAFKGMDKLDSNHVYVFQCDEKKLIFIWNGDGAKARAKFIASRAASELRMTLGFVYRVKPEDQGYESRDFKAVIGALSPDDFKKPSTQEEKPKVVSKPVSVPKIEKQEVQKVVPQKKVVTSRPPLTTAQPRKITKVSKPEMQKTAIKDEEISFDPNYSKIFWPISKEIASEMFNVSHMQKDAMDKALRIVDGRNHPKDYIILSTTITTKKDPVDVTFYVTGDNEKTISTDPLIPKMEVKVEPGKTTSIPLGIKAKSDNSVYLKTNNDCFVSIVGINV